MRSYRRKKFKPGKYKDGKFKIHLTSKDTLIIISNTDNNMVDLFPCIGTISTTTQNTHIYSVEIYYNHIYFVL